MPLPNSGPQGLRETPGRLLAGHRPRPLLGLLWGSRLWRLSTMRFARWFRSRACGKPGSFPILPVAYKFRHGFVSVFLRFASSRIGLWRSKMNLNALADRPAVSAIPQWVCLDPYCELMSLFEHDRKYGARLAGVLGKIPPTQ